MNSRQGSLFRKILSIGLASIYLTSIPGNPAWAAAAAGFSRAAGGLVVSERAERLPADFSIPSLSLQDLSEPALAGDNLRESVLAPEAADEFADRSAEQLLKNLEASGVSLNYLNGANAQGLIQTAQGLPEGPAKANILAFAETLVRAKSNSQPANLSPVYDAARNETQEASPAAAASRDHKSLLVPYKKLGWQPPVGDLPESTKDVPLPSDNSIIGQERAEKAIRFGLEMEGESNPSEYNLSVSGPDGSGRETLVRKIAEEYAAKRTAPLDIVALSNFENADQPIIMNISTGRGYELQQTMERAIESLKESIPNALNSVELDQQKQELMKEYERTLEQEKQQIADEIEKDPIFADQKLDTALLFKIDEKGRFRGYTLAPAFEGQPVTSKEELAAHLTKGSFTQADWDGVMAAINKAEQHYHLAIQNTLNRIRAAREEFREKASALDRMAAFSPIEAAVTQIAEAMVGDSGRHDDEAHKDFEKRVAERRAGFDRELAKLNQNGFGLHFGVSDNRLVMQLTYNGKLITYADKETIPEAMRDQYAFIADVLDATGIKEAQIKIIAKALAELAEPYEAKYREMVETNVADHQSLHANDPINKEIDRIQAYLKMLMLHLAGHYQDFLPDSQARHSLADRFKVSVVSSHDPSHEGAPVVVAKGSLSLGRMFGTAVRSKDPSGKSSKKDASRGPELEGGLVHEANGGVLIVDALDAYRSGTLFNIIHFARTGMAPIPEAADDSGSGRYYRIPVKTRVVLIGSPMLMRVLDEQDPEFHSHFKAKAQFERDFGITDNTILGELAFLKRIITESAGEILDFTRDGIARFLQYGADLSETNSRSSAQFRPRLTLAKEASFFARKEAAEKGIADPMVTAAHIEMALAQRLEREGQIKRLLDERAIGSRELTQTKGAIVGQGNGLSVMQVDNMEIGSVMRVTAQTFAGAGGVIAVNREAGMTGPFFNKAIEIIKGFLGGTFAKVYNLSMTASISFEQSGGIEGDSATMIEMLTILSSLSGIPIKQNFFVTGSGSQSGESQPIGGVNHKIQGAYDLVNGRGELNAEDPPSIIIPESNVADLAIRHDIREAAREGADKQATFRIYAVRHLSEAWELMTGTTYREAIERAAANLTGVYFANHPDIAKAAAEKARPGMLSRLKDYARRALRAISSEA